MLRCASAGVTRDRRYTRALWCGREFMCIDTGGLMELPGYEASSLALSRRVGAHIQGPVVRPRQAAPSVHHPAFIS